MPWNGSNNIGKKPIKTSPKKSAFTKLPWNKIVITCISVGFIVILFLAYFKLDEKQEIQENVVKKAVKEKPKKTRATKKTVKEKQTTRLTPKEELREKLKKMSREEREEYAYKRIQERKLDLTPTTNHPFRTGIELSMARIFMTKVGDPPPPLLTTFIPIQDEAHLTEILFANNPVIDGDSEKVQEAKATVEQVKKEMIAYIKDGGDPQSFMAHYHKILQDAFIEKRDSLKEVARVAIEEPEIAQQFYLEINKKLESKGITPIELTEKQKQRLGLE